MRRSWSRRLSGAGGLLAGSLLIVIGSVFPLYWLVVLSLKSVTEDVYSNPFCVYQPTFENYVELIEDTPFLRWSANSLAVIAVVGGLTIVVSMLAGYALARLRPPGTRWIARLLFASYLLPQTVIFLPLFKVVYSLGLDGSLLSLVLTYPTLSVPFCSWLFYSYFLYASTFLPRADEMTVAAGVGIQTVELEDLGVAAAVNMFAVPLAAVCLLFSRSYVQGLTAAMLEGA